MDFWAHVPAIGSIFNAGAIVVGGGFGLLIGRFIPKKLHLIIFQCFGLFCLYMGVDMALKTKDMLIVLISLVLGAIVGELADLDARLLAGGEYVKTKLKMNDGNFTEGFVTTTLLFCVGSMAILGAIEEGARGNPNLLFTKGVMDGTSSILFAASLGIGTLFAALPLLLYQGTLTLAAGWAGAIITPAIIANLTGLGGLMIVAIGLNLLKIVEIKTCNLLPALIFVSLLTALF